MAANLGPLQVDRRREKLVEAIAYFSANTKHCGLVKLFKLLYWLDYHHFRETGRDVTGLAYLAYPMGPVPQELHTQFVQGHGDVVSHFDVERNHVEGDEYIPPTIDSTLTGREGSQARQVPTRIKPKFKYRNYYLTPREQRIAEWLAEIFRDATAKQISDVSHAKGGPWSKALKEGGERALISFLSSLLPIQKGDYLDEEELRRRIREYEEERRALA